MTDPNATVTVIASAWTPTVYCALGRVTVDGLWNEARPQFSRWRPIQPPVKSVWKTPGGAPPVIPR